MTASFSGRPSAVPALCPLFPFAAIPTAPRSFLLPFSVAIYHLARILSVCTITALSALCLLFPFAIILAAPRSFLLPFSLACLLSAPFAALFYCRICLLCRPFRFIPHPPHISPNGPSDTPGQQTKTKKGPLIRPLSSFILFSFNFFRASLKLLCACAIHSRRPYIRFSQIRPRVCFWDCRTYKRPLFYPQRHILLFCIPQSQRFLPHRKEG